MNLELLNLKEAKKSNKIILLGASGSIGKTSLEFIASGTHDTEEMEISGLSVYRSVHFLDDFLSKTKYKHLAVAISDDSQETTKLARQLEEKFPEHKVFYSRTKSMKKIKNSIQQERNEPIIELLHYCKANNADTVINGIVGAAGIFATLASIQLDFKLCLANKESLVIAGPVIQHILKQKSKERKCSIIPIDSEHNSLLQLIEHSSNSNIHKYILSASGGPFYGWDLEKLKSISIKEVLKHPTWQMGPKITVDSALMTNKGFEIIEAHFLFCIPYEKLKALIHRPSLVHSLIEFEDGSYCLSGSQPHMLFPISHALLYPRPTTQNLIKKQNIENWEPISFHPINNDEYPNYALSLEVANAGGTAPAIFNASNEILVDAFLQKQIKFLDIPQILSEIMQQVQITHDTEIETFLQADTIGRVLAREYINKKTN